MTKDEAIKVLTNLTTVGRMNGKHLIIKALQMAIEALEEAKKREETWEWCTDCKEYDQENHCCHRFNNVIHDTLCGTIVSGEWIPYPTNDCTYKCSNCGFVRDAYLLDNGNFCPNCGAEMKND